MSEGMLAVWIIGIIFVGMALLFGGLAVAGVL
jgi:hypothetical protein